MQLFNQSNRSILTNQLIIANSLWSKTKGLIGADPNQALYFQTRFGIHTFGMKYSLYVIICDNNLMVKEVKQLFLNRFFFWNPRYSHVFELPEGEYHVKIGDKLEIQGLER